MPIGIVKNKLDVIEDRSPCKAPASVLIVLLPGAYDTPADLVRNGFVDAVRARKINADVVIADTHAGYYTSELVVERLHHDIVVPGTKKGYRQIWLAGISLGGYGSLLYARQHAAHIDGLFLMAPFLGNRSLLAEIAVTGLAEWHVGEVKTADYDRQLWSWIKGYSSDISTGRPPLYIGYGNEDRFAGSNAILATVLPALQVFKTEGGHTWLPWKKLWNTFLVDSAFPHCRNSDVE